MAVSPFIQAGESNIEKFDVTSNYTGETVSLIGKNSFIAVSFYESLFDCTVRADCTFTDAGYAKIGAVSEGESSSSGYNLTVGEKTEIKVMDGYGQRLYFEGDYHLRHRLQDRQSDPRKTLIQSDFCSLEFLINNNRLSKRAKTKFEGKPSDNITILLKNILKTSKDIKVDKTIFDFNFLGYNEKVLYHCINLCTKGVPEIKPGVLAGFLFYEVFKDDYENGGYNYRSIDKLFEQKPKRKYIYNESTGEVPGGYQKIINFKEKKTYNAEQAILSGFLSSNYEESFDSYIKTYNAFPFNFDTQFLESNNAAKDPFKIASDTKIQEDFTRLSSIFPSIGYIPPGPNWTSQQPYSKTDESEYVKSNMIKQAENRINQLFSIQITIIIPMDFGLHVGDLVECNFGELSSKEIQDISKNKSGIYMIMDLCHRITKKDSYTSLRLCRDASIFKK